jgi:hypothetical protein
MSSTSHSKPEKLYPTGRFTPTGENLRVLARDRSNYVPPLSAHETRPRLDAIAVPTHRRTSQTERAIRRIMSVASQHRAGIVIFLCSDSATKEDLARITLDYPNQRWIAIDWRKGDEHRDARLATTLSRLARGKNFNASEKRNFILELARLMGWKSVLFMDDDIDIPLEYIDKAAYLLDDGAEVVGFNVREFPDHSVVVHANQMVNSPVDSFIGTGAMAVRIDVPFLSFFPNTYCNDWLFALLHSLTTDDGLVWAGTVEQKPYEPFRSPARAEREEPGDLMAEGLFRLVMEAKSASKLPDSIDARLALIARKANEAFWEKEITARVGFIQRTLDKTKRRVFIRQRGPILSSLSRSLDVINGYDGIAGLSAKDFAGWIQDWVSDLRTWNTYLDSHRPVRNLEKALSNLGYSDSYLYGNSRTGSVEDGETASRKHILYRYLKNIGEDKFNQAMFNHDNKKFMQEFAMQRSNNLLRLIRGVERLRYDRPLSDTGIKPYMTVIMFVRVGEPTDAATASIREIARLAKGKPLLQVLLWVYTDGNDSKRQLNKFRNSLVSELLGHIKNTNIMLASSVVRAKSRSGTLDQMLHSTSQDILMAYWKLGRRPLPGHNFLVVNSKNEPLRAGSLKQLLKHEHAIADKSLAAYVKQYHSSGIESVAFKDSGEIAAARQRIRGSAGWKQSLRNKYARYSSTLSLMRALRRARLTLPTVDDLAQTIEFHDPDGWTSIQNRRVILVIQVDYRQSLPGDIYGIVRRIGEAAKSHLDGHDYKACTVIVRGEPGDSWDELQSFRQSVIGALSETHSAPDIVFSSLVYRRDQADSHRKAGHIAKAMCRYIYWLENHRIRQRFSWYHISRTN